MGEIGKAIGELLWIGVRANKAQDGYEDGKSGKGPSPFNASHPFPDLQEIYLRNYEIGQQDRRNDIEEEK